MYPVGVKWCVIYQFSGNLSKPWTLIVQPLDVGTPFHTTRIVPSVKFCPDCRAYPCFWMPQQRRYAISIVQDHVVWWHADGVLGLPSRWINPETCVEQPLHRCYTDGLHHTERLALWSRHFCNEVLPGGKSAEHSSALIADKFLRAFLTNGTYHVCVGSLVTSL
jgi:hypothetical protein